MGIGLAMKRCGTSPKLLLIFILWKRNLKIVYSERVTAIAVFKKHLALAAPVLQMAIAAMSIYQTKAN